MQNHRFAKINPLEIFKAVNRESKSIF